MELPVENGQHASHATQRKTLRRRWANLIRRVFQNLTR